MNVSNIAYSTVNVIIKELFESYSKGSKFVSGRIATVLRDDGLEEGKIKELLDEIVKNDPFDKAKKQLEIERSRIGFIKDNFPCVEPVTVQLNPSEVKDSSVCRCETIS